MLFISIVFLLCSGMTNLVNNVVTAIATSITSLMGNTVALKNAHNQYLTAFNGQLTQNFQEQLWRLEPAGNNRVYIVSVTAGQRLMAHNDGKQVQLCPNSGDWEKWTMQDMGNGKVIFTSHFNVSASCLQHVCLASFLPCFWHVRASHMFLVPAAPTEPGRSRPAIPVS